MPSGIGESKTWAGRGSLAKGFETRTQPPAAIAQPTPERTGEVAGIAVTETLGDLADRQLAFGKQAPRPARRGPAREAHGNSCLPRRGRAAGCAPRSRARRRAREARASATRPARAGARRRRSSVARRSLSARGGPRRGGGRCARLPDRRRGERCRAARKEAPGRRAVPRIGSPRASAADKAPRTPPARGTHAAGPAGLRRATPRTAARAAPPPPGSGCARPFPRRPSSGEARVRHHEGAREARTEARVRAARRSAPGPRAPSASSRRWQAVRKAVHGRGPGSPPRGSNRATGHGSRSAPCARSARAPPRSQPA